MLGMTRLILLLGDQLSAGISSLAEADPAEDVVLMAEVAEEAGYVPHHKKKLAFVFSAMRHFAEALRAEGWQLRYTRLDDPANSGSLAGEIERARDAIAPGEILCTEPGEWRLREALAAVPGMRLLPDTRFLIDPAGFRAWAQGRRGLRMEYFYRDMRRRTGLLMDGNDPAGGEWNYDQENRGTLPAGVVPPTLPAFEPDAITREVLALVARRFPDNFGALEPFALAVTRAEAEAARDHFLTHALPRFGDYQDAMRQGAPVLFHAHLALYLNAGLLDPLDLCRRAEAEWRAGRVPLNAAEGFIRQILGWREYVRGIYWLHMPRYAHANALEAHRPLPDFYWTAETDMACMRDAVEQTRTHAYAHHIQRLMVTGNFALLAGIDPYLVHIWYMAVYADAYEWVEMPNTIGMALFADGGIMGSKPYAASGAYIDRMSDYCANCRYQVKRKAGPDACPFNYLYWNFIARHRERFARNPRMGPIVRNFDRMDAARKAEIAEDAGRFLDALVPAGAHWTG
ncbi:MULTISPECIES: cryptochrome/photolyase family protein [unclassified Sphingomonas]|uniref:cryptochrome/photolyase family protein n=1 Tax=unclassified Sphingomonas TaxID=196159 RepID=UPI0002F653D2|nr:MULTISPECIES: cryptochrome/photolyase family protein [unclassified Sphingomonas]KTF67803.1 deoxyribodipyrimidine photolyase [Sphingomonas sp. WG]